VNKKNFNTGKEVMEHSQKSIQSYGETMLDEMPTFLGFSARLNMLWDLTGIVPSLNDGRVLAVLAINKSWRENEVRGWLEKDILPERLELRNMVRFLIGHLNGTADELKWEAFILYGVPIVSSPIEQNIYRADEERRRLAAMIFAKLTDQYHIPPSSYEADAVFQKCLALMHRFNIYTVDDFQAGHLEPFRHYLFPD